MKNLTIASTDVTWSWRVRAGVLALALGLATVLLLGACGGGGDDSASPTATRQPGDEMPSEEPPAATDVPGGDDQATSGDIEPCSLLTREEVETATGVAVSEGQSEVLQAFSSCTFTEPDSIFSVVSVTVYALEDGDQAREAFELGSEDWERISGIGEDAYWAGPPFNSLEVLVGRFDISVSVSSTEGGGEQGIATDLANLVIDRLP
jgi:hypothetical protein